MDLIRAGRRKWVSGEAHLRLEETLSEAHLRLAAVTIECLPWHECVAPYDRAHTLLFCDPPYWQTEGHGVEFPFEEYERLADVMKRLNGKAILTVNDHPRMREVFRGLAMHSVGINYTVGGNHDTKAAHELTISSS